MAELLFKDDVYRIQGAVFDVYREQGSGFLEAVYQEALEREFAAVCIPFIPQQRLTIAYKGVPLRQEYIADFVCCGKIIIELKAVSSLNNNHLSQVLNYLKATGLELGLLVNLGGEAKAACRRVVRSRATWPRKDTKRSFGRRGLPGHGPSNSSSFKG